MEKGDGSYVSEDKVEASMRGGVGGVVGIHVIYCV